MTDTDRKKKVLIVGGGIAGLTVAHELSLSDKFEIVVCDQNPEFGGKARSLRKSNQIPIEHAMRVLLASYGCLYRIMQEIPARHATADHRTAYDSLVYPRFAFAYRGMEYVLSAEFTSVAQFLRDSIGILGFFHRCGVPYHELLYFLYKVGRLLWLPPTEAAKQLGPVTFEEYLEASQRTSAFREVLLRLSEMLVAAKRTASAFVNARLVLEWYVGPFLRSPFRRRGFASLDGPTSERLIDPWVELLRERGVQFVPRTRVIEMRESAREITGVVTADGSLLTADLYCFCLPHNVLDALVGDRLKKFVPSISDLTPLGEEWSAGFQYFLKEIPPEAHHLLGRITIAADSPWSLVSMIHSEGAPWRGVPLPDGIKGVLSLVVSNCRNLGISVRKPFIRCSREELLDEALAQTGYAPFLARAIGGPADRDIGPDLEYMSRAVFETNKQWFDGYGVSPVDDDTVMVSDGLLYVRAPGNETFEPPNATDIHNLFIAGEYTRTRYSTPTMEKSCESGMRCAQSICISLGVPYDEARLAGTELPLGFLRSTALRFVAGSVFAVAALAFVAWIVFKLLWV